MRGKASQLYRLAKNSADLMTNHAPSLPLETQCQTYNIISTLNSLKFAELRLSEDLPHEGIGIRNILLYKSLRLSIYYIPKGQTMKLHDHPRMQVINHVLKGKMQGRLYTNISNNLYRKETHILEAKSIKFIDGNRNNIGNLHEFKALEPTFFLDIIFPDYDQNRTCTHFEEELQAHGEDNVKSLKAVDHQVPFFQL